MDIILFLILSFLIGKKIDKHTRIGTIAYTIGAIFIFCFYMFVTNDPYISRLMTLSLGKYYLSIRSAISYGVSLFYMSFNALMVIQVYFLIITFLSSFFIVKEVVSAVKKIKTKIKTYKQKPIYNKLHLKKVVQKEKIFLLICRLNN